MTKRATERRAGDCHSRLGLQVKRALETQQPEDRRRQPHRDRPRSRVSALGARRRSGARSTCSGPPGEMLVGSWDVSGRAGGADGDREIADALG